MSLAELMMKKMDCPIQTQFRKLKWITNMTWECLKSTTTCLKQWHQRVRPGNRPVTRFILHLLSLRILGMAWQWWVAAKLQSKKHIATHCNSPVALILLDSFRGFFGAMAVSATAYCHWLLWSVWVSGCDYMWLPLSCSERSCLRDWLQGLQLWNLCDRDQRDCWINHMICFLDHWVTVLGSVHLLPEELLAGHLLHYIIIKLIWLYIWMVVFNFFLVP